MDEEILIVVHEKSMTQSVQNVVKSVKFHSSRLTTLMETLDLFTARNVLEKDEDSKKQSFSEPKVLENCSLVFIFLISYLGRGISQEGYS